MAEFADSTVGTGDELAEFPAGVERHDLFLNGRGRSKCHETKQEGDECLWTRRKSVLKQRSQLRD